mgnify:CR=1 FL=1
MKVKLVIEKRERERAGGGGERERERVGIDNPSKLFHLRAGQHKVIWSYISFLHIDFFMYIFGT